MLDRHSWAVLTRLTRWLEQFAPCFGRRAQVVSLRQYLHGLLGDSPRKSMQAMLARVTEPQSYQAFQHFITHAPWSAAGVWRRLLAGLPERRGLLILDDTAFLKQGTHSVGVAKQYASLLKKLTLCQVAVTASLWTGARGWLVGAELYLPETWLTPARRHEAHIPGTVRFQEKWRLALTLVRRARAAGLEVDAVLADAGYGMIAAFRTALDRMRVPYVVGIPLDTTVFVGCPRQRPPRRSRRAGHPETRPQLRGAPRVWSIAALIQQQARTRWRRVSWRNGQQRTLTAEFLALRVSPVVDWRTRRQLSEVWLIAERSRPAATPHRYYFSNLPVTTTVPRLARLIHQRWAIEQQYQELKDELGIDHFEGRTYPGWHHHVVLSALAYAFLQLERRRAGPGLTFPQIRAITQEILTGLLFITRDHYWDWLQRGRRLLPLRI